jgi:hypothetical protein
MAAMYSSVIISMNSFNGLFESNAAMISAKFLKCFSRPLLIAHKKTFSIEPKRLISVPSE